MRWWRVGLIVSCLFTVQLAESATLKVQITVDIEVFAQPDLNAKVIETVPKGQYLTMKTDKVVGSGGIGVFYKVKTQRGRVGFVVDSDLPTTGDELPKPIAPAPRLEAPPPPPPPRPRVEKKVKPPAPTPPSPPLQKENSESAWGLVVGAASYSEKFEEQKRSATQLFFGFRWTSAGGAFLGGRADLGAVLSPNAPKFLSSAGASGKTSGFIFLADPTVLYDVLGGESFSLYVGAGPLLGYSKYSTNYNGLPKDSSGFKLGAVAASGFSLDFSSGLARLEVRYFIESNSYLGGFLVLQLY